MEGGIQLPDPMVVTIQLTDDVVEVECPGSTMETTLCLPPALIARGDGPGGPATVMVDWVGNVWVSGMDADHPQVLHRGRRADAVRMFGEQTDLLDAITEKVVQGRKRFLEK